MLTKNGDLADRQRHRRSGSAWSIFVLLYGTLGTVDLS